jgi:hypothetical protein
MMTCSAPSIAERPDGQRQQREAEVYDSAEDRADGAMDAACRRRTPPDRHPDDGESCADDPVRALGVDEHRRAHADDRDDRGADG